MLNAPQPCRGISGLTPLGFMAGLGMLDALRLASHPVDVKLSWAPDEWSAVLHFDGSLDTVVSILVEDARTWGTSQVLEFAYPKVEKAGAKPFRGLKAPVPVWRAFLERLVAASRPEPLAFAAALASETATEEIPPAKQPTAADLVAFGVDKAAARECNRSVLPTFFDFTSRNAQFLDQVNVLRTQLTEALFSRGLTGLGEVPTASRTMGWDAASDRPGALYSYGSGTNPVLEWLAFRSLRYFPVAADGSQLRVACCTGRRKAGRFTWPLWTSPLDAHTIEIAIRQNWSEHTRRTSQARGVELVVQAELGKAADGYQGVFLPSRVVGLRD